MHSALKIEKNIGFASFFAIFDDFSKWSTPKALWDFEKSSIMGGRDLARKLLKKALFDLPFFG